MLGNLNCSHFLLCLSLKPSTTQATMTLQIPLDQQSIPVLVFLQPIFCIEYCINHNKVSKQLGW